MISLLLDMLFEKAEGANVDEALVDFFQHVLPDKVTAELIDAECAVDITSLSLKIASVDRACLRAIKNVQAPTDAASKVEKATSQMFRSFVRVKDMAEDMQALLTRLSSIRDELSVLNVETSSARELLKVGERVFNAIQQIKIDATAIKVASVVLSDDIIIAKTAANDADAASNDAANAAANDADAAANASATTICSGKRSRGPRD